MNKLLSACCVGSMVGALAISAQAATIDLTGLGFVQYGDAESYSMPIANYQFGFNTNTGPYAIDSSPGQISALTVLGTGSEGVPVTTNFAGMDNAYSTPSGVSGATFFYPNAFTDRGFTPVINNNLGSTWDTSLAALKTFLAGEQMVVFFNNNQTNSLDTAAQSLAAWARVWITDANGVVVGSTYEFTNMDGTYNLVSLGGGGVFMGDVTTYTAPGSGPGDPSSFNGNGATDFVLSGGQLCVITGPGLPVPVPVPCGTVPPAGFTVSSAINHNLGADHVAYSILFPELNAALAALFGSLSNTDLANYTLHADIRLGCDALNVVSTAPPPGALGYGTTQLPNWMDCGVYNGWGSALNNGYEQIFIGTALTEQRVPEPGSMVLFALALTALGVISRRRSSGKGPGASSR